MMVAYGDFEAEIEHIVKWDYHPIYDEDGVDFLYNHLVIGVQCWFNPWATSWPNTPEFTPRLAGNFAGLSVRELKQYIMQPRRQLIVEINGRNVVQSPQNRPDLSRAFLLDAKDGPTPINFQVLAVHGTKTMLCYFEIATWINDCAQISEGNSENPGPFFVSPSLVSHRWENTHSIDEQFMTTRTISGRAVFRSDFMLDHPTRVNPRYPDDYRNSLFHPIPNNCQRKNVRVTAESNGYAVNYSFDDEEQWVNLDQTSGVVKCKGTWTRGFDSGTNTLSVFFATMESVTLTVEVWGARATTKQQLINACFRVAATFGFGGAPLRFAGFWKSILNVDIVEKYTRFEVGAHVSGAFDQFFRRIDPAENQANTALAAANNLLASFPDDIGRQNIDGNTTNQQPLGRFADAAGFSLPNDNGTRGSFLERMVTQALLAPCMAPPSPVALGPAFSINATDGTKTPEGNWINTPASDPGDTPPIPTDS